MFLLRQILKVRDGPTAVHRCVRVCVREHVSFINLQDNLQSIGRVFLHVGVSVSAHVGVLACVALC